MAIWLLYKNHPDDIPFNYLTGEKLKVNEHPGYLEFVSKTFI